MSELLYRIAAVEAISSAMTDKGLARLSFASELPVFRHTKQRGRFNEILSHAPGDANLGLLNTQGIVLQDHDQNHEIGEVVKGSARVEADKKTRATIRIIDEAWKKKLANGEARAVSVGYELLSIVGRSAGSYGVPTLRFSWRPYEISLLTGEPADETVGIGRSQSMTRNSSLDEILTLALSGSRKTEDHFSSEALREYSLASVLSRLSDGSRAIVPQEKTFEHDMHAAGQRSLGGRCGGTFVPFAALQPQHRDLQATIPSGNSLVSSDMHPVVDLLRNRLVLGNAGATMIGGLSGNFQNPRVVSAPTAAVTTEIGAAVNSDIEFDQQYFAPVRGTIQVTASRQFLMQTGPAGEDVIRRCMRQQLALLVDRLGLYGQGANSEPTGIFNTPGIGSVVFAGAANWNNILAFEQNISLQNSGEENLAWAVSPTTRNKWKSASRISATNYPSFIMEDGKVNDSPAVVSNQMSATNRTIYGNWPSLWILVWSDGIDVTVNPYTLSAVGKVIITAHLWFNICVSHPQEFCVSADSAAQ